MHRLYFFLIIHNWHPLLLLPFHDKKEKKILHEFENEARVSNTSREIIVFSVKRGIDHETGKLLIPWSLQ
jgi:hypothetical protein